MRATLRRPGCAALDHYGDADASITNPPYVRPLMHALIQHFARILPTWLLIESDWAYTKQAGPFMPCCSDIVAVGRLRWIEGTTMSGKQNFSWYRFDARHLAGPIFHPRGSVPVSARGQIVCAMRRVVPIKPLGFEVVFRRLSAACLPRAPKRNASVTRPRRYLARERDDSVRKLMDATHADTAVSIDRQARALWPVLQ